MGLLRDRLNKERKEVARQFDKETKAPIPKNTINFNSYLDFKKIGVDLPFYYSKVEKQKMDIMMWFAGSKHPTKRKDDFAWQIIVYVHNNIGPMREKVICPYATYGEPCPICEFMRSNRLPIDTWKMYKEKERLIQLVWPHTTPEMEKAGLHVWDVDGFSFIEEMKAQAINPEDGGTIQYADPDYGSTFYFTRTEEGSYTKPDGTQGKGVRFSGIRFAPRKNALPDHIVDAAEKINLDEALIVYTYDELDELFKQTKNLFGGKIEKNSTIAKDMQEQEAQSETFNSNSKCPANGNFGVDNNKLPECGECPIYDDCMAEKRSVASELEKQEEEKPRKKLLRRAEEPERSSDFDDDDVPY